MKRLTRILARRRRGKNFANTTTIRRCAAILAYAACLLTRSAPLSKHKTTAEVSAISVFSAASTASSFSAAQGRTVTNQRPSCEQSDDREYTCLLSSPPGAFDDEIRLYLSVRGCDVEQQLAVKIVVSGMAGWSGGGGGRGRAWASVGFSPNGRMAGPSEAVVGVAGDADGDQEPKVRSYRLDGYSPSSVTPLPARDHTLTDEAVETTSDGFLVVRFTRPFSRPVPTAKITCAENMLPKDPTCGATSESNGSKSEFAWMDPREAGVVVLWAYGARTPWPSYHDATGSFVLPHFI